MQVWSVLPRCLRYRGCGAGAKNQPNFFFSFMILTEPRSPLTSVFKYLLFHKTSVLVLFI